MNMEGRECRRGCDVLSRLFQTRAAATKKDRSP